MTPSLQVSPPPSPYDKGDKCLCKCKWAIFNNIHYLHVIYVIAFLGLDFYILALGKLPLVPGGCGGAEPRGRMETVNLPLTSPCAFQGPF